MEETIGEESNSWDSVGYSENIVELERTVSWSMVGLQIGNTKEFKVAEFVLVWLKTDSTERERESDRL